MNKKNISPAIGRSRRVSRLGVDVCCARCGYDHIDALVFSDPILCAVCDARERGVSDMEQHHLAGQAHSTLTIALNANAHREMTALQVRLIPQNILCNPIRLIHQRTIAWLYGIAVLFIWLAEHLTRRFQNMENL